MKKTIRGLLLFFVFWQMNISLASQRLALVIGNGDYNIADGKLSNPPRDARAIAKQLQRLGFEVILKTDLYNKEAMEVAVDDFTEQLSDKEIGLFYYAGHALQMRDHNYLMPTNAKIKKASQVRHRALDTSYLLEQMADYKPQLSIVILDACRDNPFPKDSRSGASRGLGRMQASGDMIIAFATEPGSTADDGDGEHSPYTEMLLKQLTEVPYLPIYNLLNKVGVEVLKITDNKQSPRLESSPLQYSFCFADCASQQTAPAVIRVETPGGVEIDQNSLFMIISGIVLLSGFLAYSLFYRKNALYNDNVVVINPPKIAPVMPVNSQQQNDMEPDLSSFSGQAFAYLCDASSHTAVGVIECDKPAALGRSSKSTIRLVDSVISAHHAEISWHPGSETFLLQDNGSTNGTWVEQQQPLNKLTKVAIQRGEVFYLGHKDQAYYIY